MMNKRKPIQYLGFDTETVDGRVRIAAVESLGVFDVCTVGDLVEMIFSMRSVGARFIVYNLAYDADAILKLFPVHIKQKVHDGFRVSYRSVSVSYRFKKILKLSVGLASVSFYDAFQFFGCSLDKASRKYLGKGKLSADTSNVTEELCQQKEFREYCLVDATLVGELFRSLLETAPDEIQKVEPISPAYWSQAYFKDELNSNKIDVSVNRLFRQAFRGGRFEVMQSGYFSPVYMYDIRSAYPFQMTKLRGAHRLKESKRRSDYGWAHVRYDETRTEIAPLQKRTSLMSCCPSGHVFNKLVLPELVDLPAHSRTMRSCDYASENSDEYPFREKILRLYELKKLPTGYVYKIVLNSLYGKFAQVIRSFQRVDSYYGLPSNYRFRSDGIYTMREDMRKSNFALASYVTAGTRKQLWDVMKLQPTSIISCATDSIFSTTPIKFPANQCVGENIGDWEEKVADWLIMVGSGIYFYSLGGIVYGRMRGIPLSNAEELLSVFESSKGSIVALDTKRRYSFRELDRTGDYTKENLILAVQKRVDLNFDKKRLWDSNFSSGADLRRIRRKSIAPIVRDFRRLYA